MKFVIYCKIGIFVKPQKHIRLMERMTVSVAVHPTIREFILDTNGSDTLIPDKSDLLWKLVKANLTTYQPDKNDENLNIRGNKHAWTSKTL